MHTEADPRNRLNDLNGKAWLQFQKSWFPLDSATPGAFIRFFTKSTYPDGRQGAVLADPPEFAEKCAALEPSRAVCAEAMLPDRPALDYIIVDATTFAGSETALARRVIELARHLREMAYLTLIMKNRRDVDRTHPVAWRVAASISESLRLKDEKIGCTTPDPVSQASPNGWIPDDSITYFLNFRKEPAEPLLPCPAPDAAPRFKPHDEFNRKFREAWFIHKPPPRARGVLLHPAKFPEDLVERYVRAFTAPGETVFDPMAGTGSSLIAADACERIGTGIELNADFIRIAKERQSEGSGLRIVEGDAAEDAGYAALGMQFDYAITSPPYWDMLRMRGAETQKRRKEEGLQRWYSDAAEDLGNISSYKEFLDALVKVYELTAGRLRSGRYLTIVVKNVKKQGVIYPLAWDLTARLQRFLVFAGEQIWCQDDQRLAPFGYRYSWVSNTFHHYCLTFRKP